MDEPPAFDIEMEDADNRDEDLPIALMARDCETYFLKSLDRFSARSEHHTEELWLLVEEYHRRFNAWAAYLGVFGRKTSSLDYRLRNHSSLQDMVLRLLEMLRQNVFLETVSASEIPEAREADISARHGKVPEPQAETTAGPQVFPEQFSGIKDAIVRLNKFGLGVRSSSRATATARARRFASRRPDIARLSDYENLAHITLDCLYPDAPKTLRQQLASSMADRYVKLKYEAYRKGHHENGSGSTLHLTRDVTITGGITNQAMVQTGNREVSYKNAAPVDHVGRPSVGMTASSIDTSRLKEVFGKTASNAAATRPSKTMTVHASREKEPPLPTFEEGKEYATCQFCFQVINHSHIRKIGAKGIAWSDLGRRHYQDDLKPYVCISEACAESRPAYSTMQAWHEHMIGHSSQWAHDINLRRDNRNMEESSCPLCSFRYEDSSETSEESDEDGRLSAPFSRKRRRGVQPATSVKRRKGARGKSEEPESKVTWALSSHVAAHLRHLMIISLQLMSSLNGTFDEDGDARSITDSISSSRCLTSSDGNGKKKLEESSEDSPGEEWPFREDNRRPSKIVVLKYRKRLAKTIERLLTLQPASQQVRDPVDRLDQEPWEMDEKTGLPEPDNEGYWDGLRYVSRTPYLVEHIPLDVRKPNPEDDFIADIICVLIPTSTGAEKQVYSLVEQGSAHVSQKDLFATYRKERSSEAADEILKHGKKPLIILRFSERTKNPLQGFTFGRYPAKCDICFTNDTKRRISNIHFHITVSADDLLWLEDFSTNGTIVDGHWLKLRSSNQTRESRMQLQNRSIIALSMHASEDLSFIVWRPLRSSQQERLYRNRLREYSNNLIELEKAKSAVNLARLAGDNTFTPGSQEKVWAGSRDYNLQEVIGKSAFATLHKAVSRSDGVVYTAKELERRRYSVKGDEIANEIKLLRTLRHPNLLQFIDYFESDDKLWIMMEYAQGGDLAHLVDSKGPLRELLVEELSTQLLSALDYLHQQNVIHRDIKPDNILFQSQNPIVAKLTGFELAEKAGDDGFLRTFCGTLLYCAPEVYLEFSEYDELNRRRPQNRGHNSAYSYGVDIWSLGCTLFYTLTGQPPFPVKSGMSYSELLHQIMTRSLDVTSLYSKDVSANCIEFLERMLQNRPEKRAKIEELLQHRWLTDNGRSMEQEVKTLKLEEEDSGVDDEDGDL